MPGRFSGNIDCMGRRFYYSKLGSLQLHFFYTFLFNIDWSAWTTKSSLTTNSSWKTCRNVSEVWLKHLSVKYPISKKILLLILRYLTLSWYVGTAHESIFANKQKKQKNRTRRSWASLFRKNRMGNSPVKPGMHHPENVYMMMAELKSNVKIPLKQNRCF